MAFDWLDAECAQKSTEIFQSENKANNADCTNYVGLQYQYSMDEMSGALNIVGAIIGAVILGIADMVLKRGRPIWLACLLYTLTTWPALLAFRAANYRVIFNTWACAAVLFTVIVSVGYYHEPMTWRKWLASALVVTAMLLE